jgi:hypothetical protein
MIEEIVAKYIAIRDEKTKRKAAYTADVAKLDAALDKIEAHLLTLMQAQGLKSLPTAAGTPYIQHRSSASIADWPSYKKFLMEQEDPFLFLEQRVNKTMLDEYRAANDDLPPGVNWNESVVVNVKRS